MNFNKCSRCGSFFISDNLVCPNCEAKDQMEINKLKNYIEENANIVGTYNMDNVISSTGITYRNLNRFLAQEQFADFAKQINQTKLG